MYAAIAAIAAAGIAAAVGASENERNIHMSRANNQRSLLVALLNMMREDNATQRRVADLRAAGLSPTLAAGSPAASNVSVSTQAPKSEFSGAEAIQTAMQALALRSQIGKTEAEREYIQQQMQQKKELFPREIRRVEATTQNLQSTAYERNYNVEAAKRVGVPSRNVSAPGAIYRDVGGAVKEVLDGKAREYKNIMDSIEKAKPIMEKTRKQMQKY